VFGNNDRGFASIPVKDTIRKTSWRTSILSNKKSGTYFLPLKARVRKMEQIKEGGDGFVFNNYSAVRQILTRKML
jgi:hypothetical protein